MNCFVTIMTFTFKDFPNLPTEPPPRIREDKDDDDDDIHTEEELPILPDENHNNSLFAKFKAIQIYLSVRFKYLYNSPIVLHSTAHALLILVVYSFVQYPIALGEADIGGDDISHRELANFCGGYLENVFLQGSLLSVSFLIGSILYFLTLVKCPPTIYYLIVLPILLGITATVVGALLFHLPSQYLVSVLVSIGQIVPYYMNAYDYYIFTTYVKAEYYGFQSTVYNFLNQVINNITAILLSNSISLSLIIITCVSLLGLSLVYGIFIYTKFKQKVASNTDNSK